MALDWWKFFDGLVIDEDSSWKDVGGTVKKNAQDLLDKWLSGNRAALQAAVRAALKDKKLSPEEVVGILASIALVWADEKSKLGDDTIKGLLNSLRDGELTPEEIALLAGNWIATYYTDNNNLQRLIQTAALGNLDKDKVFEALLDWLDQRSGKPELKERIKRLLTSAKPVNLRSLILITSAYLIHAGKLVNAGATHEKMVDDLVAVVAQLGHSTLADAFEALADQDYAAAARLVLDELGLDDDKLIAQGLIRVLLREKPEAAVEDFLSGALKRELGSSVDDKKAKALARTIMGIITGRIGLIPEFDLRQYYAKVHRIAGNKYAVWQQVQRILYGAKLVIAGGAVVPVDAMAPPHVFAMVAIEPPVKLKTLAAEDNWGLLAECIFKFTRGAWKDDPAALEKLTEVWVTSSRIRDGQTAEDFLEAIYEALYLT